jgi:hypothetical protein
MFDSPSIFQNEDLLPGWQVLYDLMKQLANLFHWFHYELTDKESEALHNFSNVLSKIKESLDRDISGLSDTLSLGVLPDLSVYKSEQAKEQLCDHTYSTVCHQLIC